ncbi:hypothetical protein DH2020_036491 [Rehmannia glutinosa]|uniref:RING-type E3 ubiquitin transferase n=1 Tax=Rehmannia glutinosa TaxID=99300 RepID=A0ABR0V6E3_REHGL
MATEEEIQQSLQELQKQLGKKHKFEDSVSTIRSLLQQHYSSASPNLRKAISNHCLESMMDNAGYLFEGHLTVDPEPPQPDWLVRSNLLTAAATLFEAESSEGQMGSTNSAEGAVNLMQELISRLDDIVPEGDEKLLFSSFVTFNVPVILETDSGVPRVPPASKEVVAKLPVNTVTEEVLVKLGKDAVCSICQENLVVDDKMQELPCKHMFHPPCLKPWLDKHNSCPICRHELKTDDHAYESWKEREKEAEEERKGAANAVRGGEYMYV